jgi:hypothetical protein
MEFKYIAIISGIILFVFLLYKEVNRTNKSRLVWRIIASLFAVTCFVLLIIPISYKTHFKQAANEITLITEGANIDSVRSIKGKKYLLADQTADFKSIKASSLVSLPYFLKSNPDFKKLNVYGYGLTKEELENLNGQQIAFHPSENPTGIISCSWNQNLKTTEQLFIQGVYQNNTSKNIKLILTGLGNQLDSVSIKEKSSFPFNFKNKPQQTGKAVYKLIALQGKDTISVDPVPFQTSISTQMKVLILASFPDFEYKFLKKWLYENQYPLAFRSQISKNKFSTDFLNLESQNLNQISAQVLKKFDVLIIDEEELNALSSTEKAAINQSLNNGMGLFIRISDPKAGVNISNTFGRYELSDLKDKTLALNFKNDEYKFSKLPAGQTLFLKAGQNDQPVITDANKNILVNSQLKGFGKLLVSTIPSTYNWLLSGKKLDYTSFWSLVLSSVAKKKITPSTVQVLPEFPTVNQKTRFIIEQTESNNTPVVEFGSSKLSLRQNIALPFQWDATIWSTQNGWNSLTVNQSEKSFYVFDKNDWKTLKNQQKIISNSQFVKNSKSNVDNSTEIDHVNTKEISIWYFFIGFLFASAFLWYESRILQNK